MFNLYYNAFNKYLMNIILMGYMGSGKTIIGLELSRRLGLKLIDLDLYIEENEKLSVQSLFKLKGDLYFRNIETKYLKKILRENKNIILSLGGGTPCYNNNLEIISSSYNLTFYLKNSNIQLAKRLINEKEKRPIISEIDSEEKMIEFVSKHLFEREYFYMKSGFTINCNDQDPERICDKIISNLN